MLSKASYNIEDLENLEILAVNYYRLYINDHLTQDDNIAKPLFKQNRINQLAQFFVCIKQITGKQIVSKLKDNHNEKAFVDLASDCFKNKYLVSVILLGYKEIIPANIKLNGNDLVKILYDEFMKKTEEETENKLEWVSYQEVVKRALLKAMLAHQNLKELKKKTLLELTFLYIIQYQYHKKNEYFEVLKKLLRAGVSLSIIRQSFDQKKEIIKLVLDLADSIEKESENKQASEGNSKPTSQYDINNHFLRGNTEYENIIRNIDSRNPPPVIKKKDWTFEQGLALLALLAAIAILGYYRKPLYDITAGVVNSLLYSLPEEALGRAV